MALWDAFKNQFRSVIEWEPVDKEALFELWSDHGDEIKDASKLILGPGQGCVLVYEGKIKAILTEEGMYDIETSNVPFITTLTRLMQRFESEHKVGLFFFWRTQFVDQKWGTTTPVKYVDPVYQFPIELRAHGNFTFKITNPEFFFVNIVGSEPRFAIEEARTLIAARFVEPLSDLLAESGYGYTEIDRNRNELSAALREKVNAVFEPLGFELNDFRIEGTTFDEETKRRIGRVADITAESAAAKEAGVSYTELQQLEALRDAAKNEGGAAGAGVGIGAGVGLGQVMAGSMMQGAAAGTAAPTGKGSVEERLRKLKDLREKDLITQEDYEKQKIEILKEV